jgi:Rrf2 family protein
MLSKSCIYALRSLVYIGQNATQQHKLGIKEIAEELDLPSHFLSKILQRLVKHKVVQSVKGPHGGFYLNEKSKETTLLTIIEVIDGLAFFTNCGLGLKECSETHPCPLHDDFKVYRDGLYLLFNNKKISELITKIEAGNAFIRNIPNH